MKLKLYYHVYLTDDYGSWAYPFMEQMKLMEDTGLYEAFDTVTMTCISQDDGRLDNFAKLCGTFEKNTTVYAIRNTHADDKAMLSGLNSNVTVTENAMMQYLYKDCVEQEDFKLLYLHTKGVTSIDNHLKTGGAATFKNYHYWRQFLNWGVIERWRDCVAALDTQDIAGVNYYREPTPHFSGNFWWANSSYIKTLPDPATVEWWKQLQSKTTDGWLKTAPYRFRDELWPCSKEGAKVGIIKTFDAVKNFSFEIVKRKDYV